MVASVLINCSFNFGLPYGQYIPSEGNTFANLRERSVLWLRFIAQDDVSSESKTQQGLRASFANSGEGLASKDVHGILDYY
jgi:hypothetical protein